MSGDHVILSLNRGSSSLRFALYQLGDKAEKLLATGAVERIGLSSGHLWIHDADKTVLTEAHSDFPDHQAAVHPTFATLKQLHLPQSVAVGHRLVHGGPDHAALERVTPQLIASLRRLVALRPARGRTREERGGRAIPLFGQSRPAVSKVGFGLACSARVLP